MACCFCWNRHLDLLELAIKIATSMAASKPPSAGTDDLFCCNRQEVCWNQQMLDTGLGRDGELRPADQRKSYNNILEKQQWWYTKLQPIVRRAPATREKSCNCFPRSYYRRHQFVTTIHGGDRQLELALLQLCLWELQPSELFRRRMLPRCLAQATTIHAQSCKHCCFCYNHCYELQPTGIGRKARCS